MAKRSGAVYCGVVPRYCGVTRVDRVVVNKGRRELLLLSGGSVLRSYRMALGFDPAGHKTREGDGKTPEGHYTIERRNPASAYHLSLRISYPNETDRQRAAELGVDPGGDIMIHGLPNGVDAAERGHPERDWTRGCIAVTNAEIEEIWNLVEDGTPVEIHP
jgi:murein L,D-transpeptidase YafK